MQKAASIRTNSEMSANVQPIQPLGLVLIDIEEVMKKMGFSSERSVYNYIKKRGFPRPRVASRRNARWLLSEVDEYIVSLPQSSGGNPVPRKAA